MICVTNDGNVHDDDDDNDHAMMVKVILMKTRMNP